MATVFKRGGTGNRRGRYYVAYFDHKGRRQVRSARTTDKSAAERIAAKLEADAALRREGVIDPHLEGVSQQSRRTVESHLDDYKAKLSAANSHPRHITNTETCIRAFAEAGSFEVIADINADAVNRFAHELRGRGRSLRTVQAYLTAIKSFTRWLADNHKLPRDPLSSVKKPNPQADRKRRRRMLLPEEWSWLRDTTAKGPVRFGMAAAERVLLYAVAIQTGLRSNELRSLTRGRLFLDHEPPFITCEAGSAKNRKVARQYVQCDLAEQLQTHVATHGSTGSIFQMPHATDVARMLRADLDSARAAWLKDVHLDPAEHAKRMASDFLCERNHEGEVLDFHSLRHTCGAWLAMTGAHPKAVQAIMRHSTIVLTMDTYGHLFPGQEAETISRLPKMMMSIRSVPCAEPVAGTQSSEKRSTKRSKRGAIRCETVRHGATENAEPTECAVRATV
jgi:integrase